MKVVLAWIAGRGSGVGLDRAGEAYVERLGQYVTVEGKGFRSEAAFLEAMEKLRGRTAPVVILLDERGKMFSSEEFAGWVGARRDGGAQTLVFAVGPANGWAAETRKSAGLLLSLGAMTLPHELAKVVLAEQVYRAFTILAGHPYHRE